MTLQRSGAQLDASVSVSEIWILDADESTRDWYADCLQAMFKLRFFSKFKDLDEALDAETPELLITDLKAEDDTLTGYFVKRGSSFEGRCKVLVAATTNDPDVIRHCFEFGCEDFLAKPINHIELAVKVERLIYPKRSMTKVQVDPVRNRLVGENAETIELTSKEFVIFYAIYHSPLRTITKDQLVKHVWSDVVVGTKTLDVHIFNIRKKVAPLNLEIKYFPPNTYSVDEKSL